MTQLHHLLKLYFFNDYYQVHHLESSLDPNCLFLGHLLKMYYVLQCYIVYLLVIYMVSGGGELKNYLLMEVSNKRSTVHCSRVQKMTNW